MRRKEYDAIIVESNKEDQCGGVDVDLDIMVHFVDGDMLISDSYKAKGDLLGACKDYENFVVASLALAQ
jgi:hypothetical protein